MSAAHKSLTVGTANFIQKDFNSLADFLLQLPRLAPLLTQVDVGELLGQHHARLSRYFRDPRLRSLFTFQDLYVGLSPFTAPGVFSLLAATEICDGVWYPKGGFGKVVEGLRKSVEAAGVEIVVGREVRRILTDSNQGAGGRSRVRGVLLEDGRVLEGGVVVTNVDVGTSYGLIDSRWGHYQQQRITDMQYSAGVIEYNWCLDVEVDGLAHHTVFLSGDYEQSWQRVRGPEDFCQNPNFYIHAPCRTDRTAAPPGCDSLMVLLPVANMQERRGDEDYKALVDAGREAVLRTLDARGFGVVRHHIVHEEVVEPKGWKDRYGLTHGAAFGLAHGLDQLAALRPPVKDERVHGLYFVGASTRPGNGVPLVMMGSKLTSDRICADLGIWRP